MVRRLVLLFAIAMALVAGVAVAASLLLKQPIAALWSAIEVHTPGELIRYGERRLEGHGKLEAVALPLLHFVRAQSERPVPETTLPTLGKGARTEPLPEVRYDADGRPEPASEMAPTAPVAGAELVVTSPVQLQQRVDTARAGQVIEIAPGSYRVDRRVETRFGGTALAPIVVRARRPGSVVIEFANLEGFIVSQPYWVFENLVLRGVCAYHGDCEHAFHVVGAARGTVIRNNRLEDFNAEVKVNGSGGHWPDDGLLQFNSIVNHVPRQTDQPVTAVDIVGASRWRVQDNVIEGFVKAQGDGVSYGVFIKGAGTAGRIERNLVVCTPDGVSQPGVRVGISFGGGGTGAEFCRDGRCLAEHFDGLAVNNVVAHCNDFGIDVNRSARTLVAHNTLVNTAGIDVRQWPASAFVYGNLLDGRIRVRGDAELERQGNEVASLPGMLEAPDRLRLAWRTPSAAIRALPSVASDFCGTARTAMTRAGAAAGDADCADRER
jgi:hypothetical protein